MIQKLQPATPQLGSKRISNSYICIQTIMAKRKVQKEIAAYTELERLTIRRQESSPTCQFHPNTINRSLELRTQAMYNSKFKMVTACQSLFSEPIKGLLIKTMLQTTSLIPKLMKTYQSRSLVSHADYRLSSHRKTMRLSHPSEVMPSSQ